jgi:hypothetical protein
LPDQDAVVEVDLLDQVVTKNHLLDQVVTKNHLLDQVEDVQADLLDQDNMVDMLSIKIIYP